MPPAKRQKYFERLPYHDRFPSNHFTEAKSGGQSEVAVALVFPDIPDDLIQPIDRQARADDWDRLHSDTTGDPMNGYPFDSPVRRAILATERAAERLGVAGVEQLDSLTLADLRAQQALGELGLRAAFE